MVLSITVTFIAFTILWLMSLKSKNVAIIDCYWGFGFCIVAACSFISSPEHIFKNATPAFWICLIVVYVWSLRLGIYLMLRHFSSTGEDRRYAAMREAGGKRFEINSLFKIFWLQALILLIVSAPLFVLFYTPVQGTPNLLFWIAVATAVFGFGYEAIADRQLQTGKATLSTSETHQSGLWRLSRHPNYFGSLLFWWSFAIMVFALTNSLWVFAGPALLTAVLLTVVIPLTEKHMRNSRSDYEKYARQTSMLIPLPIQHAGTVRA